MGAVKANSWKELVSQGDQIELVLKRVDDEQPSQKKEVCMRPRGLPKLRGSLELRGLPSNDDTRPNCEARMNREVCLQAMRLA